MDCSPPGSSVHEIFQARILQWIALSYSRGISPIQESNSCLLHLLYWQVDSLPLWHLGSLVQCLLGGKMVPMSRLTRADSEREQRPWWWFESLTQGISSRFPLANHLALPGSESVWFISGSSPTCVHLLVKMESGKMEHGLFPHIINVTLGKFGQVGTFMSLNWKPSVADFSSESVETY